MLQGVRVGGMKRECVCVVRGQMHNFLTHTHTHTHSLTHSPSSTVGTGPDGDVDGTDEGKTIFGVSPGTVLQRSPRQQHE